MASKSKLAKSAVVDGCRFYTFDFWIWIKGEAIQMNNLAGQIPHSIALGKVNCRLESYATMYKRLKSLECSVVHWLQTFWYCWFIRVEACRYVEKFGFNFHYNWISHWSCNQIENNQFNPWFEFPKWNKLVPIFSIIISINILIIIAYALAIFNTTASCPNSKK